MTFLNKLENILNQAIDQGIASSVSLKVTQNNISFEIFKGIAKKDTVYDLASLTKILLTTPLIAKSIADGKLSLKQKPFLSWPNCTLEEILAHRSGLPAHIKFYKIPSVKDKETFFKELFLINPSQNKERVYSDLGFLALGYFLEKIYKKNLKILAKEYFYSINKNLGLKYVKNQVHDENTRFINDLCGHAGLFGTIFDVDLMGQYFLKCFKNPRDLEENLLKYFAKNRLGFDKPQRKGSVESLSPDSFGHFGFTGTSLWVDPKKDLIITLLTDRFKKDTKLEGIFWLRKKIHKFILNKGTK